MKEYKYRISMKDKETGEHLHLYVWGQNCDEATHKLSHTLFGMNGQYIWCGSGPEYDDRGKLISREASA